MEYIQFEKYNQVIKQLALREYPKEALIFITDEGAYLVDNIALNPLTSFAANIRDTLYALRHGLKAVVHSHPGTLETKPSQADLQTQVNFRVPFGLVGTDGQDVSTVFWWGAQ